MNEIKIGKYQHYKGRFYEVLGVARHSETLEEMEKKCRGLSLLANKIKNTATTC